MDHSKLRGLIAHAPHGIDKPVGVLKTVRRRPFGPAFATGVGKSSKEKYEKSLVSLEKGDRA